MASRAQWTQVELTRLIEGVQGYSDVQRVVQELEEVVKAFRSLKPKMDKLVRNDGSESMLVCLEGTIPMFHNEKKYNCPLCIWVDLDFPNSPPTCYVKPTHDMAIKPRHMHVDSAGFVYHMYLTSWTRANNIKALCDTLSAAFSQDAPVYALQGAGAIRQPQQRPQPAAAAPAAGQPHHSQQPPPKPQQPKSTPPIHQAASQEPDRAAPGPPPQSGRPERHSAPVPNVAPAPGLAQAATMELEKATLVAMVSSKLQSVLDNFHRSSDREFETYQAKQVDMEVTGKRLSEAHVILSTEKSSLHRLLDRLDEAEGKVEGFLTELRSREEPPAVSLVQTSDALAEQLIEAVATDRAIEDALYQLEKEMQDGKIETEDYLQLVLRFSRRQFFEKELANKILAKRRQLGVN